MTGWWSIITKMSMRTRNVRTYREEGEARLKDAAMLALRGRGDALTGPCALDTNESGRHVAPIRHCFSHTTDMLTG